MLVIYLCASCVLIPDHMYCRACLLQNIVDLPVCGLITCSAPIHPYQDPCAHASLQGNDLVFMPTIPTMNLVFGAGCMLELLFTCAVFYARVVIANRSGKRWWVQTGEGGRVWCHCLGWTLRCVQVPCKLALFVSHLEGF